MKKEVIFKDNLETIFGKRPFITEEAVSSTPIKKEENKVKNKKEEVVEKKIEVKEE